MDLAKLRMMAGVEVKPEHFTSKPQKKEVLSESQTGRINGVWVVAKPASHKYTVSDVLMHFSNVAQIVQWARHLETHVGEDTAHEIMASSWMFLDRDSAKMRAQELLVRGRSKAFTAASKPEEAKEEEEEDLDFSEEECEENEEHCDDEDVTWVHRDGEEAPAGDDVSDEEDLGDETKPVTESELNFDDEVNSLTWAAKEDPINVIKSQGLPNAHDVPKKVEEDPEAKIKVPAELKTALRTAISDVEKDFQRAAIHDINSVGFYPTMIEVLQGLLARLEGGTVSDIKMAQIDLGKLQGAFLHKIPNDVVSFIYKGGESRALKDIFAKVKVQK